MRRPQKLMIKQHERRRRGERRVAPPPPNSGEKVFFGQTSRNIRADDIFLEGRTSTLYFLTVFCFSFHVYVEYGFEFRNPF